MSEIPFRSHENMPLSPSMLCAGFMLSAAEVTSPYERAETYASFVPHARKAEKYAEDYAGIARTCANAARQAVERVLDLPPEEVDRGESDFTAFGLLRYVASITLDETLIRRLDETYRNPLLVELAARRQDAALVPPDVVSQDAYKRKIALRDYNVDTARQIEDPARRARALTELLHELDARSSRQFDVDLDILCTLETEAWNELRALPDNRSDYPDALVSFAITRGPSFIAQIPQLRYRLDAIDGYRGVAAERGDAEGVAWCKDRYAAELASSQDEVEQRLVTSKLSLFAMEMADPSIVELIPDAGPEYTKLKALTHLNASIKKAIITNDAEALLALEDCDYRQQALRQLAVLPGNEHLLIFIEDVVLQLQAVSEIAGIKNDMAKKWEVFNVIKLDLMTGGVLAQQGADHAQIAINLKDPTFIRPLIEEKLLPPMSLARIAVALKSPELADAIKNSQARSSAMISLAIALRQTSLIESSGASSAERARAYAALFARAIQEQLS